VAFRCELLLQGLQAVQAAGGSGYASAFAGEQNSDLAADAARGSDNEHNLIFQ
jgi:hypothetical protein